MGSTTTTTSTEQARSGTRPGLFLVLEGVEGAGKTTQAAMLAAWLRGRGHAVTVTREPGGTDAGEAVRAVLLDRPDLELSAETELLLVLAARAALVRQVVEPAVAQGRMVVADRFSLSTFAYQGYGRGLDLPEVQRMDRFARGGLEPDLVVLLDLPVRDGVRRQRAVGKGSDRIEGAGARFHERVAAGYHDFARREPSDGRTIQVVDGLGTPDEVHERIVAVLRAHFPGTF